MLYIYVYAFFFKYLLLVYICNVEEDPSIGGGELGSH